MKLYLEKGNAIGDLKVGALLAQALSLLKSIELGHQLEAIFYYLGHELGTILSVKRTKEVKDIPEALKNIISQYNIGDIIITESTTEIITLKLKGHSSSKDLIGKGIKSEGNFCSFEAGMLAGIVERMSNTHCFAQELNCSLQSGEDACEFMIVFQKD